VTVGLPGLYRVTISEVVRRCNDILEVALNLGYAGARKRRKQFIVVQLNSRSISLSRCCYAHSIQPVQVR